MHLEACPQPTAAGTLPQYVDSLVDPLGDS